MYKLGFSNKFTNLLPHKKTNKRDDNLILPSDMFQVKKSAYLSCQIEVLLFK